MSKKTFVAFGADILAKLKEDASPLEGNNTTEKAKKADNQGEIASKEEVAKANAKANEDQDQVNDTIAKKEGKPTMKRKLKEQTDEFMDLIGSALAEADGELRINEKMKTYGEEEMGGGDDTFDFDDDSKNSSNNYRTSVLLYRLRFSVVATKKKKSPKADTTTKSSKADTTTTWKIFQKKTPKPSELLSMARLRVIT